MAKGEGKPIGGAGMMYCEDGHSGVMWIIYDSNGCPACNERSQYKTKLLDSKDKSTQLRKELKLARFELKAERDKRIALQMDAKDYLTKKKQVEDLVSERL